MPWTTSSSPTTTEYPAASAGFSGARTAMGASVTFSGPVAVAIAAPQAGLAVGGAVPSSIVCDFRHDGFVHWTTEAMTFS